MGEKDWPTLEPCVSPPAAIGPCTLPDRKNHVHCWRYGQHISAINARICFVMRPLPDLLLYRNEGHFSPRKFYATLREGIQVVTESINIFFFLLSLVHEGTTEKA